MKITVRLDIIIARSLLVSLILTPALTCITALPGTASPTVPVLDSVLYLPLNESSGNPVDALGNITGITLVNNPLWRPQGGRIGGALEFNGVNNYVSVPNNLNIDLAYTPIGQSPPGLR